MKRLLFLLALVWPMAALANTSISERADAASQLLADAREQLDAAETARDRVSALTEAISAYEEGLAALRSGLRLATRREAELAAALQDRDAEVAALLAVLLHVGAPGSPVVLLHPAGPVGTARAGMLLSEATPALAAQSEGLRRDYQELQVLRDVQETSMQELQAGLKDVQTARAALNQAIADRTELPKRFTADPVREAILLSSADTLASFAANLGEITAEPMTEPGQWEPSEKGALPLPVQGRLQYAAQQPDAAGIARAGILVSTLPQALVTSPTDATLRYVGPLLDLGKVVILEPRDDVLFVFAGLDTTYVQTGDIVAAGAPLGLMGGSANKIATDVSTDGDETGLGGSEALYIEVRQNNMPEDPQTWFRTDQDG
jgi:septal ring factor EnvC (AmiA/AmiB activator)